MAKPTAPLLLALVCAACLAGGAAARSLKGLNDDVRWVAPAAGGDCTAACRNNGGIIDGGTSGHALCAYKGEAGTKTAKGCFVPSQPKPATSGFQCGCKLGSPVWRTVCSWPVVASSSGAVLSTVCRFKPAGGSYVMGTAQAIGGTSLRCSVRRSDAASSDTSYAYERLCKL